MCQHFKEYLLNVTNASACEEIEVIQSLWSGYGKISRYQLHQASLNSVVVKFISLNQAVDHPRGWNTTTSHARKVKSYEIETQWYLEWSQHCNMDCYVPRFIGSTSQEKDQWLILEDLNTDYPLRKYELNYSEVKVCLKWLANFHANFLTRAPKGLWETGTYWHLNTRPDEYEKLEYEELKSKARTIDKVLNQCAHQTIIHGDAKLANFCFSESGERVAAVDFQYVGGGCGMKDVAYFLGSCLTSEECELYQKDLLDYYFLELKSALIIANLEIDFKALENEWRALYPFAIADFTRFLLGWMPAHQKINKYHLDLTNIALSML